MNERAPSSAFREMLPVSYLLFTSRGRLGRMRYWIASVFNWSAFYVLYNAVEYLFSYHYTLILYPLLFWALTATAIKRLQDQNLSALTLLLAAIPLFGPLMLLFLLGFRRGSRGRNGYGDDPLLAADYFRNPDLAKTGGLIVDDVTQINPVEVARVVVPQSVEALQDIIKNTNGPVSIGGGRFSMGGQTASRDSVHIDMRSLNHIVSFSPEEEWIEVEAGIRWCDIQAFIDQHGLSLQIMQTYANFTVGGALSVNCHGRYIGYGPLILSVRELRVITADGTIHETSSSKNPGLFYACVGCYNAVAVIATARFSLDDNVPVERTSSTLNAADYQEWFVKNVRNDHNVVFHNADLYPPHFTAARAVSWSRTEKKPTTKTRLMTLASAYPIDRYFIGAFSRSRFGKWRRQFIYEPLLYRKRRVHWRNYEAGYDVAELEPRSRKLTTYVLQEYFVPVAAFERFREKMAEIFTRNKVNVINVSVRHAHPDPGSMLAWAREEVFAFVVWYRQGTDDEARKATGNWTREMIDAVLSEGGTYYLPYQPHGSPDQFHKAFPQAQKLFELKDRLDPHFKFRNSLWNKYYNPPQ